MSVAMAEQRTAKRAGVHTKQIRSGVYALRPLANSVDAGAGGCTVAVFRNARRET